jgi:2-polyprenyl-3-methyl-5-hydroxy-6-metoxy-1,4-benzoquinol methylase
MFNGFSSFNELAPSKFFENSSVDDAVVRDIFQRVYPELARREIGDYNLNRFCTAAFYYPTILRRIGRPLSSLNAIEIGGGNGMKSLPWASLFRHYASVDLSETAQQEGREIARACAVKNLEFINANGMEVLTNPQRFGFSGQFDVLILYAVIEHLTLGEREHVLQAAQRLLIDGGVIVVAEAPNRLVAMDSHTTQLPFFQFLPDDLALRYLNKSPRVEELLRANSGRDEVERLYRMGRGVSFHEFELFFDQIGCDGFDIVSDGFDAASLNIEPLSRQELDLEAYLKRNCPGVPRAFGRYWIDFVAQSGVLRHSRRRTIFLEPTSTAGSELFPAQADWACPLWVIDPPGGRIEFSCVDPGTVLVTLDSSNMLARAVIEADGIVRAELDVQSLVRSRPPSWHQFVTVEVTLPNPCTTLTVRAPSGCAEPLVVGPLIHVTNSPTPDQL